MKKVIITESGKIDLEKKVANLKLAIDQILRDKAIAFELSGDGWHDNPSFNQLAQKEEQAISELSMLQKKLASAHVVSISERNTETISLGSIVNYRIHFLNTNESKEMTLEISGNGESNLEANKTSYDSPIGSALMGMKLGDVKEVVIPKSRAKIEILNILSEW